MINCTENKRHEPNVRYLNDLMLNNKLTGNLADLKDADESGALRMTTLLFYLSTFIKCHCNVHSF